MKKNILNISRLHQQGLWSIIKMLPDDHMQQNVITDYKIINPDDKPSGEPMPMVQPRNVTVEQYAIEVAAYQQRHAMDLMAPGIQIIETYSKENVLAPEIVDNINIIDANTVPPNIATFGYDLIVVGVSDTGVNIFKEIQNIDPITHEITGEYSQLQLLSDARDAGVPIIFTHDCMEVNSFCEPFPDDYPALAPNFGIESWGGSQAGIQDDINTINNIELEDSASPVVNSYFELPISLEVQPSHSGGITLVNSAKVIYKESSREASKANYYLATFEELGKGKIVYCLVGHCYGNYNQFFRPSIDECKILVNAIVWCLQ